MPRKGTETAVPTPRHWNSLFGNEMPRKGTETIVSPSLEGTGLAFGNEMPRKGTETVVFW